MPVKLENGIKSVTEPKCSVLPLRLHDTVTKSQRILTCCYLSKFIHAPSLVIPDWESIKTKYDDITTLFLSRYPKNQDADDQREFKHKNPSQEFSKERIVAKIKSLRLKYRKALDTGRRSGGGRVVAQFYDICSHIWSGSPAAEAIQGGIDTSSTASANTSTEANSTDDIQPLDEADESDSAQSQPEYQESSKRH